MIRVEHGDCIDVMARLRDEGVRVDAVVTDPPAGISFMGKGWDGDKGGRNQWIHWMQEAATLALELAKPGAHALVWALPRTSHWTATAWEDAGWEVRDRVSHLFGTGFPKNRNALKPAMEDWWLLRKPLSEKNIAANVLEHGTGALNIDACRVPTTDSLGGGRLSGPTDMSGTCGGPEWDRPWMHDDARRGEYAERTAGKVAKAEALGRWPSNLIHDGSDEVLEAFAQFGERKNGGQNATSGASQGMFGTRTPPKGGSAYAGDTGTAARFFKACEPSEEERMQRFHYSAKASKRDRAGSKHPTIKPLSLMRYLCRLVTPPGGLILDPFAGSGTTLEAAALEGFRCIGIEREEEYYRDCLCRIERTRGDLGLFAAE